MKIEYKVRNLELYEQIECNNERQNGQLFNCISNVTEKKLEPSKDDYIMYDSENKNTVIEKGSYLFVQGIFCLANDLSEVQKQKKYPITEEVLNAAEQLWLEFLWSEKKPADNLIYLRVLYEENGFVFQLMRKVKTL